MKLDVYKLRKSLGLSQKIFAKILGVTVHTIANWERGRFKPEGATLQLLNTLFLKVVKELKLKGLPKNFEEIFIDNCKPERTLYNLLDFLYYQFN